MNQQDSSQNFAEAIIKKMDAILNSHLKFDKLIEE